MSGRSTAPWLDEHASGEPFHIALVCRGGRTTTYVNGAPLCRACGHTAGAHDAPAGPCHSCPPADAKHRYEPEETRP